MGTDNKMDITTDLLAARNELKLAQEKITTANRLYSFISHINQMIIRTTDELSLFKEACLIAINVGKFRMAWIGKLDASTNKVIPIVHAGEESKYLSMINPISIDDIPEGRGPTGSALRDGKYFVSNDIQNDPQMLPWKLEAKEAGYNSSIALPIKKDGKTIAAFSIYSSTKNFFDKSEIDLLLEVVEDISFAIATIEKETHRKLVEHQLINSEARFRALIEKSADMISMVSSDGKILYASPAFSIELGYTNEELLSLESIKLIHSDDIEDFHKSLHDLLKAPGKTIFIEQRHLHKNGDYIWCEGTITNSLNESGINALVGHFKNITERKKTEEEIKLLINNTEESFILLNNELKIVSFNNQFQRLYK